MKKKTSSGDVKRASQLAKENKEVVENLNKPEEVKELDKSEAGLEDPCNWGNHNPKFDKYIHQTKKRKSL